MRLKKMAKCASDDSLTIWDEKYLENLTDQADEIAALLSVYGEEGDDRITLFSEAPQEFKPGQEVELYSMQLAVPVNFEVKHIRVEIFIPLNPEHSDNAVGAEGVILQRSDSGNHLHSTVTVSHLPPLRLNVTLPPQYPSHEAPTFSLSCSWLSGQQLETLCSMLDSKWAEGSSMPILFTWMEFLENNTASVLGLGSSIVIKDCEVDDIIGRGIPWNGSIEDLVREILQWEMNEKCKNFQKSEHECTVCFMEYFGNQMYQLTPCEHLVCQECMKNCCTINVKEGTLKELKCPDTECQQLITPDILREVLDDKLYQRYEDLALSQSLDSMEDVFYCPRCQQPAIEEGAICEGDSRLAYCHSCQYAFCPLCWMAWHQGEKCKNIQEELAKKVKKLQNKIGKDDKRRLAQLQEYQKNELYISKARKCPKCQIPFEKIEGCNKVGCTKCGCSVCYLCGADISAEGYSHFGKKCELFSLTMRPVIIVPRRPARPLVPRLPRDPNIKLQSCPYCKQRNAKDDSGNNHIKCIACSNSFCFLCKEKLRTNVTEHFRPPKPCQQHTKDS